MVEKPISHATLIILKPLPESMTNPLLETTGLPAFSKIRPEHVEPAIDQVLQENRAAMQQILANKTAISWENTIEPLDDLDERLNRIWSPVKHLNAVANTDALRAAYNACLPKLSAYHTEIGQNEDFYQACKTIAESAEFATLDQAKQKVIENALRDFRLSGIELNQKDRDRFKAIRQALSKYGTKFEENLLDATNAWKKPITDETMLSGLPESARSLARQIAEREGMDGWLFTLEFPSYMPVMTYADNADLRREMYVAFVTRASDQGPDAGKWDNSENMVQLIALRQEMARLLGFKTYADYSLATKMARDPDQVLSFLTDLASRSKPFAEKDLLALQTFAEQQFAVTELNAWDLSYYSEKLRQHRYDLSQEMLRPYFPVPRVLSGLFQVVERLYGLQITEKQDVDKWNDSVQFFQIRDAKGDLRGSFYLDLYARPHKRGGAWMDECLIRKRTASGLQYPVAYLTCNFTPPVGSDPSLLTHAEVTTLFHEFGHGLHHMLTQVDVVGVSGINGVAWDAVELPSQFMENWCWEREALDLFSGHYQSGEPINDALFEKMQAAKNFQSGLQMMRQLEFSLFDFRLHMQEGPVSGDAIQTLLDQIRQEVSVIPTPAFNRFQHSFSHIFAGGYSAGYYSYKWAEVLSADAFSLFEENGIFDRTTGERFLHAILEQGGSRDAMQLFVDFRGREPDIEPLLRHSGIATA